MNFDNYKFHPSSLGKIMTGSRDKDDPLGETCKTHLLECFISEVYHRRKDITTKYMEKGILQEEESITLYSLVTGKFHKKNKETIENDFLIGTPDLFDGESIRNASHVIDIKTSWDIFTFYEVMLKPINKTYYWQLQAYMDLSGASKARLAYCLVNTPFTLIEDEMAGILYGERLGDRESHRDCTVVYIIQVGWACSFGGLQLACTYAILVIHFTRCGVQVINANSHPDTIESGSLPGYFNVIPFKYLAQ